MERISTRRNQKTSGRRFEKMQGKVEICGVNTAKLPILKEEEKEALFVRIKEGDREAKEEYIKGNLRLVLSVIRRFGASGENPDDLFQIGCIGLIKAVNNFNTELEVKFSTYAVPMIIGEMKRFFRDDGMIKVSRAIKECRHRVYQAREKIERESGREPTIQELSETLGIAAEEVAMALESAVNVESIYKTVYQGEGTDISLIDKIPEKKDEQENLLNRIFLEELLGELKSEERRLIYMRYFRDMTQTQVAEVLGISQVQVSRMEKRILEKMRNSHKG